MTIIAKRSVQLKGHIYSKGEAAEWNGPIDSRMAANFLTKDGKELQASSAKADEGEKGHDAILMERIDKLVKEIGRKGIEQKLDELGVTYRAKMNDSQLALLLLQQQGEV